MSDPIDDILEAKKELQEDYEPRFLICHPSDYEKIIDEFDQYRTIDKQPLSGIEIYTNEFVEPGKIISAQKDELIPNLSPVTELKLKEVQKNVGLYKTIALNVVEIIVYFILWLLVGLTFLFIISWLS